MQKIHLLMFRCDQLRPIYKKWLVAILEPIKQSLFLILRPIVFLLFYLYIFFYSIRYLTYFLLFLKNELNNKEKVGRILFITLDFTVSLSATNLKIILVVIGRKLRFIFLRHCKLYIFLKIRLLPCDFSQNSFPDYHISRIKVSILASQEIP